MRSGKEGDSELWPHSAARGCDGCRCPGPFTRPLPATPSMRAFHVRNADPRLFSRPPAAVPPPPAGTPPGTAARIWPPPPSSPTTALRWSPDSCSHAPSATSASACGGPRRTAWRWLLRLKPSYTNTTSPGERDLKCGIFATQLNYSCQLFFKL